MMFHGASNFNKDISGWDVWKVTNMNALFSSAVNFNQDIRVWSVANNTNLNWMFYNTPAMAAIYGPSGTNPDSDYNGGAPNIGFFNYIYEYADGSWIQIGQDIDGEASNDKSGYSVSLSEDGTIVAIGAPYNAAMGSSSGHVRVYQYANSSWTQLGSDIDAESAWDQSGFSVSLSSDGTIVAIGARYNMGVNNNTSGHIRIYQYDNNSWSQLGQDLDGEDSNNYFGWSVSLSSDGLKVAGSSYQNDEAGTNRGHVRIYEYTNSSWLQLGQDIDGEANMDQSGYSISLSR